MKGVQSLWIGDRLPMLQQLGVRSFLSHGYDYHLYTYGHLNEVLPGTKLKDGNEILSVDAIFRYAEGFGKAVMRLFERVSLSASGGARMVSRYGRGLPETHSTTIRLRLRQRA